MLNRKSCAAFAGALVLVATAAWADINICVTLSASIAVGLYELLLRLEH